LQEKLRNLANQFTLAGLIAGVIIFIVLVIMTIIEVLRGDDEFKGDGSKNENAKSATAIIFSRIPQHVNLVVVLIVVAIPEGLPLTVGVSLAFSVMKMYHDGILVRKLDAPEKMGGCEEICCGKTATLTKNEMKVSQFYLEGQQIKNSRKDTFLHCEL
jgi:Ca2+-transporting ATPase